VLSTRSRVYSVKSNLKKPLKLFWEKRKPISLNPISRPLSWGQNTLKAVIQRVKKGSVSVDGKIVSEIGKGLVVLVCAEKNDNEKIIEWMAN